jgi:Phosphate-selective porin O and P
MMRFVLAALAATSVAAAQAPNIRVAGRMQLQYRASGGDSSARYDPAAVDQGFLIRRLRIQADARFGDNILLVIAPSFEMGALRMRDAYLRVGIAPRLSITMGQEKTPFFRYELTSSNSLPSIERGVVISGLSLQQEAMDNLVVANGYASHDLGASVDYAAPGDRFTIKVGVQGGSRESARDVNNAKSYFARATAIAVKNADDQPVLQLGASFAARDRAICRTFTGTAGPFTCTAYYADSSKMTTAVGFDLEWGGFRPGPHVIADVAFGDNVPFGRRYQSAPVNTANVLNSADSNVVTFSSIHVVGAWRVMVGTETSVVRMLEPALRIDRTDPDTDIGDNQALLITPAMNVYFTNTVVFRVGFDYYSYDVAGQRFSASQLITSWQANF